MSVWEEHVTAALLGTQRKAAPKLEEVPLAEEDAAARLLDQAGLLAVQRRAGRRPGKAEAVAPAPAETLPVVPSAAGRRLERLLGGDRARLLPEWLGEAAAHGYRVPARSLPDLLDKGRGDRSIRPFIARTAGQRGAWLALQNPDWAYLLTESEASVEAVADWEGGTRAQRVAYLTALRLNDPAAAREKLLERWSGEAAPDRAAFLATFEHGLSEADEEFLERSLDDRGKDVRQHAADLLARLPRSAYARRMAERAHRLLRLEKRTVRARRRHCLVVDLPGEHDDAMARDGIPFHPPGSFSPSAARIGVRAAWLREILARTPLDSWTGAFGLTPGEVVALPVAGDLARDVHLGWSRAALRQGAAGWARSLVGHGAVVEEAEALADLLEVLPEDERDAAAAGLIRAAEDHAHLLRLLARLPSPWTGPMAEAVLSMLESVMKDPDSTRFVAQLCRLADERLTSEAAPRLQALAERHGKWPLVELAETLRFRRDMLQELAPPPGPPAAPQTT
ncbi:DUF5691 domain-containing protein [Actinocorallia aurantiaca]|uniref:DUF5691 domain-containing protein n=1 Tax=Actinocorallia aurantiaca TaxID=46204 RepID=A0ABP6GNP5_9ACTN